MFIWYVRSILGFKLIDAVGVQLGFWGSYLMPCVNLKKMTMIILLLCYNIYFRYIQAKIDNDPSEVSRKRVLDKLADRVRNIRAIPNPRRYNVAAIIRELHALYP